MKAIGERQGMARILVIEDDAELRRTVCSYLRMRGHDPVACAGAGEAFDALYEGGADLVVSDVMMPGMDGFGLAETLRRQDAELPILFMTARDDMAAKQRGYAAGIDDYLVKPFDLEELALRIGALLRRAKVSAEKRIEMGAVVLDASEHAAYLDGEPVSLTAREFDVLWKLLANPKKAFTRSQLAGDFWEDGGGGRTIDVYIAKIRKCFAGCDDFEIATVHGLGYKAVPRG